MTGGRLKVKDVVEGLNEKINQIRIYSGEKFEAVQEVEAGRVCAVTGLEDTRPGQGIGAEEESDLPVLEPVLTYQILLPDDCDVHKMLLKLKILEEEEPELHIVWEEQTSEIHVQLMGDVQIEILQRMIKERFGVLVEFGEGSIVYKETITAPVEGVGHFEPLRHYAEVHLLLEPGKPGSGLKFDTNCQEYLLANNYQRLILSHLQEKEHLGVLTGSPITDMKITLVAGKAHLKHTEGGDFREATYRAIRQGLKTAKSVLLEPYFDFSLELPIEYLSRAIYDIEAMAGNFKLPENQTDIAVITGSAPVSKMQNYQSEVVRYTKGKGRLICQLSDYRPCQNQAEVIKSFNYDSEADVENPTGSVFCSHGAGYNVRWDQVAQHMHIPFVFKKIKKTANNIQDKSKFDNIDDELENIFTRTYGPVKQRSGEHQVTKKIFNESSYKYIPECLLVDGYNVIHAWPELKELAKDNLDAARMRLIDIMCNYQGYKKCILILVFDAYKVKDNIGSTTKYHNIYIVYPKEAQTVNLYIERATHELASKYNITVATSDALEQLIVLGQGGKRISSRELRLEVAQLDQEKLEEFRRKQPKSHNYLLEGLKNFNQD